MRKAILVYRYNDTWAALATTRRISKRLKQRFGEEIVIQNGYAVPSGVDDKGQVEAFMKHAAVLLVVISPHWLDVVDENGRRQLDDPDDFIRLTIEVALLHHIPIIPIFVDRAPIPKEKLLPESLKEFPYHTGLSVRTDPDFDTDIKRVNNAVKNCIRLANKQQRQIPRMNVWSIASIFTAAFIVLASSAFWFFQSSIFPSKGQNPVVLSTVNISISVTNDRLADIAMLSQSEGWAVGAHGTILHFNNGKWFRVPSPTTALLAGLCMLSVNEGWAVGENGTIIHYHNGFWTAVESPTTQVLYGIRMTSANEGWAVGEAGVILHYQGSAWALADSPANELLGVPVMLSTTDGWVVGRGGTILHYNGTKWLLAPTSYSHALLTDLYMVSAKEGWAVGWDEQSNNGIILHFSQDRWLLTPSPTNQWLGGVMMLSANDGWIVGRGGAILHYNGTKWALVASPTTAFLANVAMVSAKEGWAVGWNEQADTGALLHYHNGLWSNYLD